MQQEVVTVGLDLAKNVFHELTILINRVGTSIQLPHWARPREARKPGDRPTRFRIVLARSMTTCDTPSPLDVAEGLRARFGCRLARSALHPPWRVGKVPGSTHRLSSGLVQVRELGGVRPP